MSIKVSIVIPIYNAEKYVNKCIDSVVAQTYDNWEIILVNDGSTDNSKEICERYVEQDRRIKLVNQKNAGASAARNTGIDYIKGDYTFFLDADDYIERNMLERTVNKAQEGDYDIVIFNSNHWYENGTLVPSSQQHISERIDSKKHIIENILIYGGVLWNKLIKSSLITENHLKLDTKLKASEDMYMTMHLINYGKNFVYINDKLYNYIIRENSLTRDDSPKKLVEYENNAMEGIEQCMKYIDENMSDCSGELVKVVMRLQIENIVGLMKYKNAKKSDYMTMVKYIDKYRNSSYCTKYMKIYSDLIKIHPLLFKQVWKIKNALKK